MHALLLTLAIVSRALPGQAALDRPAYQPIAIVVAAPVAMLAATQDPKPVQPPQINVEVKREGGGGRWYANPVWIAIGAMAFVILVLMIVMAAKGGGSGGATVIRG